MKISRAALFLLVTTHAAACGPGQTPGVREATAADSAALRATSATFDAAVAAEDIDAMMASYAADAVRMEPNRPAAIGSAAIRELFLADWAINDVATHNELVDLRISGDLAAGRGTFTARITPVDGSAPSEDSGTWSSVWERQPDGSWLAIWDIWNSDRPPVAP